MKRGSACPGGRTPRLTTNSPVTANIAGSAFQSEFVVSAVCRRDFPRDRAPEIVIAGRSNVGKSSLINRLAGSKHLARTSSTPGKTRTINFYRLNRAFYLVDLPGYGFAKGPKHESRRWRKFIEQYFTDRRTIALVIQLVDSRMEPTPLDVALARWLDDLETPRLIVATKTDKLSGNQRVMQQRVITEAFGGREVILSSAETGAGCKEIWNRITNALAAGGNPGMRI